MTAPPAEAVDLAALLTIDVDAELRKLATAQLQGPWQLPAELCRRSLAAGARVVTVSLRRRQLTVRDDGAPLGEATLRALAALFDPTAGPERRHQALLELEEGGSLALLALAGLAPSALRITTVSAAGGLRLDLHPGKTAGLALAQVAATSLPEPGTEVVVHAAGLDAGRARTWLREVGRFASARLEVDGEVVSMATHPLPALQQPLALALAAGASATGTLWIPAEGETPRLWLLQHGLVTTHQTLSQAPTFEAALEIAGIANPRASAADLRALVAPALPALAEQALGLLLRGATEGARGQLHGHQRLLGLLFRAARFSRNREEVATAPVIPCLLTHGGPITWRSIMELGSGLGSGAEPGAAALDPEEPREAALLQGAPVALLDAAARAAITELFGLRFRRPPQQPRAGGLHERLRDLREATLDRLRDLGAALHMGHLGVGAPLPEATLTAAERGLLAHLRAALPPGDPAAPAAIALCRGRGRVRLTGGARRRLLLPRDNPEVVACVRAVATDGAWVYPACVALLGGRGLPSVGARATWQRGWGEGLGPPTARPETSGDLP